MRLLFPPSQQCFLLLLTPRAAQSLPGQPFSLLPILFYTPLSGPRFTIASAKCFATPDATEFAAPLTSVGFFSSQPQHHASHWDLAVSGQLAPVKRSVHPLDHTHCILSPPTQPFLLYPRAFVRFAFFFLLRIPPSPIVAVAVWLMWPDEARFLSPLNSIFTIATFLYPFQAPPLAFPSGYHVLLFRAAFVIILPFCSPVSDPGSCFVAFFIGRHNSFHCTPTH